MTLLLLQITRYFKANKNRSNNFFSFILMSRSWWWGAAETGVWRGETRDWRLAVPELICSFVVFILSPQPQRLDFSTCLTVLYSSVWQHQETVREKRELTETGSMFTLLPLSASVAGNSKNNSNSKPSLCLSTLPTSLSLHRQSNAKYAINKREPCEFLSKYTLSPSRTAYALSTCIHACMPTWLHVQLVSVHVCVFVCVVTHPTLLLSRGAHSAVFLLLASSYRYVTGQTNALIGWKYRTIQFLKAKCAKDPENEIIKQKTSARADKRTNVVVSTADSLRLTSCHVVSFRFVCSRSLSISLISRLVHSQLVEPFGRVCVRFAGFVPSTSSHWLGRARFGLPLETPNCCRSSVLGTRALWLERMPLKKKKLKC